MNRRAFFFKLATGGAGVLLLPVLGLHANAVEHIETINESDAVWKKILTSKQYEVLREDGTEPPFISPLNHEVRDGIFACVACGLELFPSKFKYDSGTGWPSFYDVLTSLSMANRFDPLLAINFDPPQPQNHSLIFASDGSFHHPA